MARYEFFLFNGGLLRTVYELHEPDNGFARNAGLDLLDRMPDCSQVEIYKRRRRIYVLTRDEAGEAAP